MEILNQFWVWILSILGGVSITGIISAIIYGCLKGAFNRTISKINVQKIADLATEKGVEKVKKIAFQHSIQPLVESEIKKLDEKVILALKIQLEELSFKYDKIINILDKFSAYFDNSIGVSECSKENLKKALNEAQIEPTIVESVVVEEELEKSKKDEIKPQEEPKITPTVER